MAKKIAKKIIFTGGGTVGHVTLNLLLIPRFLEDGYEVHYIGAKHGIERDQLEASGLAVQYHAISTGKLRRYFSWENLLDLFKVSWGILQSLWIVGRIRPKALFSKGGFVSVPPVLASRLLRVPVFVHESDLSMGLANKIAYKAAKIMYSTFEQDHALTKVKHVGAVTKVRDSQVSVPERIQDIQQEMDPQRTTLLFVGGSAGAKVFNDFVTEHLEALTQSFNVINLTGDASLNQLAPHLYRVDYVTDLYQPLMEMADVVVTRGGSNTIFELLAMAKLHVIVPLGRNASRGDQIENAAYFERKGYAKQIAEEALTLERLITTVQELLDQKESYQATMRASKEIQSLDSFYQVLQADIEGGA